MKSCYTMFNRTHDPVGFAFVTDGPAIAVISNVYVLERFRGQGHFLALMRAVTKDANREHKLLEFDMSKFPEIDVDRLFKTGSFFGFEKREANTVYYREPHNLVR